MSNTRRSSPATKDDLKVLRAELDRKHNELLRHFDVKAEQLVHDFVGIFRERTEQHSEKLHTVEGRLHRIEKHLGLAV